MEITASKLVWYVAVPVEPSVEFPQEMSFLFTIPLSIWRTSVSYRSIPKSLSVIGCCARRAPLCSSWSASGVDGEGGDYATAASDVGDLILNGGVLKRVSCQQSYVT